MVDLQANEYTNIYFHIYKYKIIKNFFGKIFDLFELGMILNTA